MLQSLGEFSPSIYVTCTSYMINMAQFLVYDLTMTCYMCREKGNSLILLHGITIHSCPSILLFYSFCSCNAKKEKKNLNKPSECMKCSYIDV